MLVLLCILSHVQGASRVHHRAPCIGLHRSERDDGKEEFSTRSHNLLRRTCLLKTLKTRKISLPPSSSC